MLVLAHLLCHLVFSDAQLLIRSLCLISEVGSQKNVLGLCTEVRVWNPTNLSGCFMRFNLLLQQFSLNLLCGNGYLCLLDRYPIVGAD